MGLLYGLLQGRFGFFAAGHNLAVNAGQAKPANRILVADAVEFHRLFPVALCPAFIPLRLCLTHWWTSHQCQPTPVGVCAPAARAGRIERPALTNR
jgi:hypothetical protein